MAAIPIEDYDGSTALYFVHAADPGPGPTRTLPSSAMPATVWRRVSRDLTRKPCSTSSISNSAIV